MSQYPSFEDEQKFREITLKWSLAWDTKDLATFLSIAAPEIRIDYTDFPAVNMIRQCKPEEFFAYAFSQEQLGDKRLHTQHFLGAVMFTRTSDTEAKGNWQCRARHVRKLANGQEADWDNSSFLEMHYVKIGGEWKLGGWRPHTILAVTGEHDKVIGHFA